MVATVQKLVATIQKLHYEALKTLGCYGFQPFVNGLHQGCHLDPAKGFIASCAPEMLWQLTITRRGSLPKVIFQTRLWCVAFASG